MLVADSLLEEGGRSVVGVVRVEGRISRYAVGTRPSAPKPARILVQPPSVKG